MPLAIANATASWLAPAGMVVEAMQVGSSAAQRRDATSGPKLASALVACLAERAPPGPPAA